MNDLRESADSRRSPEWPVLLLLTAIMAVAMGLRLYHLSKQSAWIDEFQMTSGVNAPHWSMYWRLGRLRGKDAVPLFYFCFYCWQHLFQFDGMTALRVPSAVLNVACIPLLYLLATSIFGRRAGIIAALCMAISPTQTWYGQSLGVYAFLQFIILLSICALYRATSTGRIRWWAIVSLLNLMAVWTHPFAVFFVCVECIYILWHFRGRLRRACGVVMLQMVVCFSIYACLYQTLSDVATPEEDFAYQLPSLKALLADWVADDAVMTVEPFSYPGMTWKFLPGVLQRGIADAHGWVDWVMIVFLGACTAWCLQMVLRALWTRDIRRTPFTSVEAAQGGLLVLVVALLPFAVHLTLTLLWRPVILQRFTCYSGPAEYIVIAAGISVVPWGGMRKGAIALLLVLYAYQLSVSIPATKRTDYLAAAAYIASEGEPTDAVVVTGTFVSWEAFRFNAGPTPYPILPAYSVSAICDKASRWLNEANPARSKRSLWAVVEPFVFTLPPLPQFEQALSERGLQWTRRDIPGMNFLHVYQIAVGTDANRVNTGPARMDAITNYAQILSDLGVEPAERTAYEQAEEALREVWDVEFIRTPLYYSHLASHLAAEGYLDLALRAAKHASTLNNRLAFAHFIRAFILGERDEVGAAREAFDLAVSLDWVGYAKLYEPLFNALYVAKNKEQARAALSELDRAHAYVPVVCYARSGATPLAAQLRLGSEPGK